MALQLFHQHFPDIAKTEMRAVYVTGKGRPGEVPTDDYALVESYCTDPNCDCRRALLHVTSRGRGIEAVISLGFDLSAPMSEPFLDPFNPQGKHAEELLGFVKTIALTPEYMARLERHYNLMKDKFGRPSQQKKDRQTREQWSKKKKKRRWL